MKYGNSGAVREDMPARREAKADRWLAEKLEAAQTN
jgi:hypothetical protein